MTFGEAIEYVHDRIKTIPEVWRVGGSVDVVRVYTTSMSAIPAGVMWDLRLAVEPWSVELIEGEVPKVGPAEKTEN